MTIEISKDPLEDEHITDINQFKCTDEHEDIKEFLTEKALVYQYSGNARTHLFFAKNNDEEKDYLIGFFTLFNDHLQEGILSKKKRAQYDIKLPQDLTVFPAIRLHYLAVDERYQLKGYGEYILAEALSICIEIAQFSGCNFVIVQAKNSSLEFYKKYGFFQLNAINDKFTNMVFNIELLK